MLSEDMSMVACDQANMNDLPLNLVRGNAGIP
jgi:hypothetical protein